MRGRPTSDSRSAALAEMERHPEWAGEAARLVASALDAAGSTTAGLDRLAPLILRGEKEPEIQAMLGLAADTGGPASRRAWALELMGRTRLEAIPESWGRSVRGSLRDPEPSIRRRAVATARSLRIASLDEDLDRLARDPSEDRALRLEAWQAILPRRRSLPEAGVGFLVGLLSAADPAVRLSAAGVLGAARLDDAQRSRLLESVGNDPLIMPETLAGAFGPPLGRDAADRWLAFLEGSLRRGWRPAEERLGTLLDAVPGLPGERRDALTALLRASLRERETRLAGLARLLDGGDPARGREVFRGPKAACATCHRVGESGGLVGPDLTRIGAVRSGPDLLESLAFPSASFAQGYEPSTGALQDGRVLQGIVANQDADSVVLREPSGTETRLRRSEIEEIGRSQVSIMPEGLIRTLDERELRDVLAFLRSLR
ncbi:MAG: c-type cytochrome [Isosphaeraceae bacterium]